MKKKRDPGSKEDIGRQIEAISTLDTTGFLLVMSSDGRSHPNTSLSSYISRGLNSSHNILHGADQLNLITEDNHESKPQRLLKE